ncbi:hypothetical protein AOQ84DRAFT_190536 [Glonium stellatum]|uniref:Zn(2)-C6 fungal-type domain-containing protein n=1 Tax=Glonium stellatum TaxID=574774 RepID=A0A8E2EP42_9PEZI|nr:hypothetical protein AOQ84DRAFT_190536 [Glonium stellatum]
MPHVIKIDDKPRPSFPRFFNFLSTKRHISVTYMTSTGYTSGCEHNNTTPSDEPPPNPRKSRRISRACDFCNRRSIRCRASAEDTTKCQNCVDYGQNCTYDRPAKRRGAKPTAQYSRINLNQAERSATRSPPSIPDNLNPAIQGSLPQRVQSHNPSNAVTGSSSHIYRPISGSSWKAPVVGTQALIMDLVEIYFEVVYPM